jgi:hypothetical protein
MRQISNEEMKEVGGALCGNVTMTLGITGISLSGSLNDWGDCYTRFADRVYAEYVHYDTGIGYGAAHVG